MDSRVVNLKSNPITGKQKELLVEYISARKDMYTGKLSPSYTTETMKQYWLELTNILNAVPDGPCKEWKQWRKTWVDMKKNKKAKFVAQKKYVQGTGGGPPMPPVPPAEKGIDDKIFDIITPVAIYGNENVLESEVLFEFDPVESGTQATFHDEDQPSTSQWDHDYGNLANSVRINAPMQITPTKKIILDTRMDTSEIISDFTKTPVQTKTPITTLSKKKISKTTRLSKSLSHTEKLLEISQMNLEVDREYKKKKIEIMEKDLQEKREYRTKKIEVLQEIANYVKVIALNMGETE